VATFDRPAGEPPIALVQRRSRLVTAGLLSPAITRERTTVAIYGQGPIALLQPWELGAEQLPRGRLLGSHPPGGLAEHAGEGIRPAGKPGRSFFVRPVARASSRGTRFRAMVASSDTRIFQLRRSAEATPSGKVQKAPKAQQILNVGGRKG
jgi:hypothetical protein